MRHSSGLHRKRPGVFVRMAEEDTPERVSVETLIHWAEHYGIKQTDYIHRALREKMERDMAEIRQSIPKEKRAVEGLPPLAERWLTPEETAIVKEQQANRYGSRAFKVDPSSFFAQFVD